jgi:hypothetical protein
MRSLMGASLLANRATVAVSSGSMSMSIAAAVAACRGAVDAHARKTGH